MITTAAIPGRPAPRLIPASAVEKMRPGSVIVDLAAETGGNCELTQPGESHRRGGVDDHRPAQPRRARCRRTRASSTRATSSALLEHLAPGGELALDWDDEITAGTCVTRKPETADGGAGMSHYAQLVVELTILALAIFLGIEVISKVPTLLHTPLMSGTNAIHGIVIVGAMLVAGSPHPDG